jgi:3-methyladenine DNA glycosylase AlkC
MEQIAMDMGALLGWAFPHLAGDAQALRVGGLVQRMRTGGAILHAAYGDRAWELAVASSSDTVRGWGAMAVASAPRVSLARRLDLIRPFADDPHFAVREWAWLAMRPAVVQAPEHAVALLEPWTREGSQSLRRFASEATRPRGVWSAHIPAFKDTPELAESLLESLRADPVRYVQDSVANWLNDASKTAPAWVEGICARWTASSDLAATRRICQRATRSLRRLES